MQRTQSPSGDCNPRREPTDHPSGRSRSGCNALNPLQGIATTPRRIRSPFAATPYGCNALNPLQGIATRGSPGSGLRSRWRWVATHSIPFRGLQPPPLPVRALSPTSIRLQRTQSPSGDCNANDRLQVANEEKPQVATHSIPFRGLQRGQSPESSPRSPSGIPLQRTQSPSGDCNRRTFPAIAASCTGLQRTQSPSGDCNSTPARHRWRGDTCLRCNALNPLQGIATRRQPSNASSQHLPLLQRTQSPSGDCNAWNPRP